MVQSTVGYRVQHNTLAYFMSAFAPSPLKCPSPRTFFTDSIQPESFSSIDKWNQVRDFLFYFGAKYKDKLSVESGVYHDRRRYAYSIGKYMNIIQHGYSEYIHTTTLNGRLIVENFCGVFAPTVGFQSSHKTTGEKLAIIKTISVELENMVSTYCKVINAGGNGDAHEHAPQIPVSDKGIIVDNIFQLCSYIMRHYTSRWPDDSERAKQWMTNPRVFQNRLKPTLDDKVTSIQLWLADNGLDDCRAAFIANGVYDVETLFYIKEEGGDTVQELLQLLNLPLGLKVLFKRKFAELSGDTVEEYRQALLDLQAAPQRREEEDMLRKAQEDEMKRAQEVAKKKELRQAGYSASKLRDGGCTAADLRDAGYGAIEMKGAGYTAKELRKAGYSASELRDAGYNVTELSGAEYNIFELKDAGYKGKELRVAGYSASKLREEGNTAEELRVEGYSAKELRVAGYYLFQLKNAGYSATELKNAGYSATELRGAGYSATELKLAGYSATELKLAGYNLTELREAGCSATELKLAGYSATE